MGKKVVLSVFLVLCSPHWAARGEALYLISLVKHITDSLLIPDSHIISVWKNIQVCGGFKPASVTVKLIKTFPAKQNKPSHGQAGFSHIRDIVFFFL